MTKEERDHAILLVKRMRELTFKIADALIKKKDEDARGFTLSLYKDTDALGKRLSVR